MNIEDSATYRRDLAAALSAVPGLDALREKSILITGAAGLIGSFLIDMLLKYNESGSNIKVYALGRSLMRLRGRFPKANASELYFVEQDVNEPIKIDFPVDYIIHAASNAYPAAFAEDPVGTILSNVLGTENLLRYAQKYGVKRLLYVSSGEVYGQGDPSIQAFEESYSGYVDPTQVRSCYPIAKRAAETLCVSYTKQYGVDTVIARPCHTYGPNATDRDNRANVQFVNSAVAGEDIIMRSKGTQMRSYCYIADCASGLLTVLLNGTCGEAYNLANADAQTTIYGFAEKAAAYTGVSVKLQEKSLPDGQSTPISYAVLNSEKLSSLNWAGQFSLEVGIGHTIDILRELQAQ